LKYLKINAENLILTNGNFKIILYVTASLYSHENNKAMKERDNEMKGKFSAIFIIAMLLVFLFTGCTSENGVVDEGAGNGSSEFKEVTDMAGRSVPIPQEIDSVFSISSAGTIMLYTIDPDLLVGVNYEFNEDEKEYIIDEVKDLPAYGQGGKINQEALIAAAPDICISYGTISESEIDYVNTLQEQTGIPFLLVDGSLESTPETYRFLGEVFQRQERCEQLAQYAEEALNFAKSLNIPEKERVSVYFGNGHESLETAPVGSPHAELFELIGADNVAVVEEIQDKVARIDISAEQIIGWDPEVIILNGEPTERFSPLDAVNKFKEDPRYKNVRAVIDDRVYPVPKYPFSWFDRPSGNNRLIGIYWLADLLYPDLVEVDIDQEARDFYSLFYHMDLNQEQLDMLLGRN